MKVFLIIVGIIFLVGYCIVKFQEGVEEQKRKLGYYDKKQQEQMDELIRQMKNKDKWFENTKDKAFYRIG